jgi:hypothetical protein
MSLYNNLTGNSLKPGDIVAMSPDNTTDKFIELTQDNQLFDKNFKPKLYELSNFQGNSGITDLQFNNENLLIAGSTSTSYKNDYSIISIKKNENETYLLGRGTSSGGLMFRVTNSDIDNTEILKRNFINSGRFQQILACFKGDELHLCYSNNSTCYYSVYDTINDTLSTEITITSSLNPVGMRYIEEIDKIVIVLRTSTNTTRVYSTQDGVVFNLEDSFSVESRTVRTTNSYFRFDTEGTNNFYNNKMYFLSRDNSFIFSINCITFEYTLEYDMTDFNNQGFNDYYEYMPIQVSPNGIFYFINSFDDINKKAQIFYSKEDFNYNSINQNFQGRGSDLQLQIIDDNSAIFRYNNEDENFFLVNYNLSNFNENPFNFLISNSSSSGTNFAPGFSAAKENGKLGIYYTIRVDDGIVRAVNFNSTESDKPLLLPKQPTFPESQYKWYIYAG